MSRPNNLLDLVTKTRGSVPYEPAQRFLALHTIDYFDDRAGNGDDVFKGGTQEGQRFPHHGYDRGQDVAEYLKHNEDLVAHIQNAHRAVAERWLAAAQANSDDGGNETMSRIAPVLSQIVAKY